MRFLFPSFSVFLCALQDEKPLAGAQCSASAVREANSHHLNCILEELANTTFFRLARVDLSVPDECHGKTEDAEPGCTAAPPSAPGLDAGGSHSAACSIDESTGPADEPKEDDEDSEDWNDEDEEEAAVLKKITASEKLSLEPSSEFPGAEACSSSPQFWKDLCEETPGNLPLVNLALNPERNTGYDGSAVWAEIYGQIGQGQDLLRRLISGWHASISVHISKQHSFEAGRGWVSSSAHYRRAVHEFPERLENLHFTFVVLLRALYKARAVLSAFDYKTASGDVREDARTNELMRHLLDSSVLSVCDALFHGFDESRVFGDSSELGQAQGLSELKTAFQRIFRLVRCQVKCQRCKLHAVVALRGLGTALKILAISDPKEALARDDLVALINTLKAVSVSIIEADKLGETSGGAGATTVPSPESGSIQMTYDLIVVGGGLAGLSAAVAAGERGARVLVLEKERMLGGNSAKASSGISRAFDEADEAAFLADTVRSGGGMADEALDWRMVSESIETVQWLQRKSQVDLGSFGILGGHSRARTFRPSQGLVGAELVAGMAAAVNANKKNIRVLTQTRVTQLLIDRDLGASETDSGRVVGVLVAGGVPYSANAVLLASGGFGHSEFFLQKYRPDLLEYPRTLGSFTTGDGFHLTQTLPVSLVSMEEVQLHPSGFVDPKDVHHPTKTLAAEILRGVGGMLLDPVTKTRFVDELGERKFVTDTIERVVGKQRSVIFLASEHMLSHCPVHRDLYLRKGLLRKISVSELTSEVVLASELVRYLDRSGNTRRYKENMEPEISETDLPEAWYIGTVVPVIHYTMGGIAIDQTGRAKSRHGGVIPGLYAAGEVSGGVHGKNRLGGNSLLECAVFGRTVGVHVPIDATRNSQPGISDSKSGPVDESSRRVAVDELARHSKEDDCWTNIHGKIYDLSGYAAEHPGGRDSIMDACGKDATKLFDSVHSLRILEAGGFRPIGNIILD